VKKNLTPVEQCRDRVRGAWATRSAIALVAAVALATATSIPASAADSRFGSRTCSTLVQLSSVSYVIPTQTFYDTEHYAVPGGDIRWVTPGAHSNVTSAYSTNWSLFTDGAFSSGSSSCSGIA
jgi:hypothetical protein